MPKLQNDIVDVTEAILDQRLSQVKLEWDPNTYICVILASEGYPENYQKGVQINGLNDCDLVFHSGTKFEDDVLKTNGGRVLGVIGNGSNIKEARKSVYGQLEKVNFNGMQYRTDIGMLIRV